MNEVEEFNQCTEDEKDFLTWKRLAPKPFRVVKSGKVLFLGKSRDYKEQVARELESEFLAGYGLGARRGLPNYLREYFRLN